jgi:hypothetical protein
VVVQKFVTEPPDSEANFGFGTLEDERGIA